MTSDLAVRHAQPRDVEAIAAIHVAGYDEAFRGLVPDGVLDSRTIEVRRRVWGERLAANPARQFVAVAELDEGVAGFISGREAQADESTGAERVACWENMYVHPRYVGSATGFRIGLALHDEAIRSLSGLGFSRAVAFVHEGNTRALRFFEMVGWQRDGTIREAEGTLQYRIWHDLAGSVVERCEA